MKTRVLVAAVGIPALIGIVLLAPVGVILAALCALAGIAGVELQRCVSGTKDIVLTVLSAALPVLGVALFSLPPEAFPGDAAPFRLLYAGGILALFAYSILRAGQVRFSQTMAVLFAGAGIARAFSAFLRMDAAGFSRVWLLLPFVLSFACDTAAYLTGKTLGRHKLAPVVSPKKTIEGAVGGLLGNLAGGLLFALLVNRFFGGALGVGTAAGLSLVCGVVAQIGDLSFSVIKREYGVKDYGRLFLDHGGVLDRFDSVLFVAPLIELVLPLL